MPNQRALEQAAGRCGRQGQPGSVNIYYSREDYYLMSKAFDIKEHNLWIIQNKLVEYLHTNYSFLFEGKGNYRISDIELPCCTPIPNVLKLCYSKISKVENLFDEKENKIFDYLMDMIKISWGLLFNELTNDDKCESLDYCERKLEEYLNFLKTNVPEYFNGKNALIQHHQKKLKFNKELVKSSFDILKFAANCVCTALCPGLAPLIVGGISAIEEISNALIENEQINWAKVFLRFGQGCLEGLPIKCKYGKQILDVISSPLFDYAAAKIDGNKKKNRSKSYRKVHCKYE